MKNIFSKTLLAIATIGSALTLPAAAQYWGGHSEAVIYEHPDFRGQALVINGAEPNLAEIRFNDTVSSIRLSGTWEICVDPHFRGKCEIIDGSVYRLSNIRMNDNITSLRPVAAHRSRHYDRGRDNNYGYGQSRGGITLFKDPGFRGGAVTVSGPVNNLKHKGFNDTISSIDLRGGSWLVCVDPDFRGRCEVIDGSVDYLKYIRMNDNISSLRPLERKRHSWR